MMMTMMMSTMMMMMLVMSAKRNKGMLNWGSCGMPEQFHLVDNPFEMHEKNLSRGFKSEFHVLL